METSLWLVLCDVWTKGPHMAATALGQGLKVIIATCGEKTGTNAHILHYRMF